MPLAYSNTIKVNKICSKTEIAVGVFVSRKCLKNKQSAEEACLRRFLWVSVASNNEHKPKFTFNLILNPYLEIKKQVFILTKYLIKPKTLMKFCHRPLWTNVDLIAREQGTNSKNGRERVRLKKRKRIDILTKRKDN